MSDTITICTENEATGTIVLVDAPGRAIRMAEISSIFEDLGVEILSYTIEKQPAATAKVHNSFKGKFFLQDSYGRQLQDSLLDEVVYSLQKVLKLRLSAASSIRHSHDCHSSACPSDLSDCSTNLPITAIDPTAACSERFTDSRASSSLGPSHEIVQTMPCVQGETSISQAEPTEEAAEQTNEHRREAAASTENAVTVASIMTSPVRTIHGDASLREAKAVMCHFNISSLLVDNGAQPPSFITKRDFLKIPFGSTLNGTKVKDIARRPVISVPIDATPEQCSRLLEKKAIRRLLVWDATKQDQDCPLAAYVGIVSDSDIFHCFGNAGNGQSEPMLGGPISSVQMLVQDWKAQQKAYGSTASLSEADCSESSGGNSMLACTSYQDCRMLQSDSVFSLDRYRAAAALWELDFSEIEITRRIGEGSFGEVFLGSFRGTKVAVKRLRAFDDNPGGEQRRSGSDYEPAMLGVFQNFFEREIEILATIRHPNVVNFVGACHTPPDVCLVTEYCARGSLDNLLHKSGLHLDIVKKVEFALDIARGMCCLHAQKPPVVHRDLKTANLLVSARFEVKVADFGLSRIKDHAQLTNSRAGLEGTIEYCAPEVLRGEPFTEKCDVWSFGVVLWELIHRQRPYADADVPIFLLMMSLGNGTLRLPPPKEELCTPGLCRLMERCMSNNPAERPAYREVLHFLETEYKVVRGKQAAMPRSDSAASIYLCSRSPRASEAEHRANTEGMAKSPPMNVVSHALGSHSRAAGTEAAALHLGKPPLGPYMQHQHSHGLHGLSRLRTEDTERPSERSVQQLPQPPAQQPEDLIKSNSASSDGSNAGDNPCPQIPAGWGSSDAVCTLGMDANAWSSSAATLSRQPMKRVSEELSRVAVGSRPPNILVESGSEADVTRSPSGTSTSRVVQSPFAAFQTPFDAAPEPCADEVTEVPPAVVQI